MTLRYLDLNRLSTGHITWKRKLDPPSIPSPGKSFGYEEGADGSLIPQAGPEKDGSLGPAYYKSDKVSTTIAEKRYKGVHWSKRTENRFKFFCKYVSRAWFIT